MRESVPQKTPIIHCLTCGQACKVAVLDPDDETVFGAACFNGHTWQVTIDDEADNPDGWAIYGFQCDNNNEEDET